MKYTSHNQSVEGEIYSPLHLNHAIALTVDVEDYFMSPECIPFDDWPRYESVIHTGMERCLTLLSDYNVKATFFFVAWLVERYPELVEWVDHQGHEIATHTYNHTYVTELDQNAFQESLKKSLDILQPLTSQPIIGHRAPAFSLERKKAWQFETLQSFGIKYDSSINPHQTYLYGDRTAPRHPYTLHGMVEIPPAAIEWLGRRWPVGGGGTLRILPSFFLNQARKRYLSEGYPPVIYIHPWEFVPEHPKIDLPWKLQCIHWMGIKQVEKKLRQILSEYQSITMRKYFEYLTQ